jgi:hypothetical protein
MPTKCSYGTFKRRDNFGYLVVHVRNIFQWISKKKGIRMWTQNDYGLDSAVKSLEHKWNFGIPKRVENLLTNLAAICFSGRILIDGTWITSYSLSLIINQSVLH